MAEAKAILNKVLLQISAERNFVSYDLQVEPITSGGANYTTALFNVTFKEGINTHHMFAKVATLGDTFRLESPGFYNTEIIAYTKLAKIYKKLENDHQVPPEHRLVLPEFYGCNPKEYEETVVLEDLVKKGYEAYDRFKSIDWIYASTSVRELAKFHALSFAYRKYYPEDFNSTLHEFKKKWDLENGPMKEYFKSACAKAKDTVEETIRPKLTSFFDAYGARTFPKFFEHSTKVALVHGDFKPSNLMHRIREDGTLDIKIVDFQTMQGSSPVLDLIVFIFIGSDAQFRSQYFDKLVDLYYTELHAAMKRLHLEPENIYSRAEFDHDMKEKLPFGLTVSVMTLPLITAAVEDAPNVDQGVQTDSFSVNKTSERYSDLINGVVNDYIKWGILK